MRYYLHNKKASIPDAIYVPAFILFLACTIIICLYIWSTFQENFTIIAQKSTQNDTIIRVMNELTASYSYIDYMIPLLVGGLLIVSLIMAFKTGASIVYAFISVILWCLALLFSAVFTNVFEQFESSFTSIASKITILSFIMHNLKWIVLAWLVLISIIIFTRTKKEEEVLGLSY